MAVAKGQTSVPHFPEEDEKLRASSLTHRRGGNCPNALEVLHQLVGFNEGKLSLITVLPSSSSIATQHVKASLGPNVEMGSCVYRQDTQEAASCYVIQSISSGSRTIVNYSELPDMTAEEFNSRATQIGEEADWYHFEVCVKNWPKDLIHFSRLSGPKSRNYIGLYPAPPNQLPQRKDQR